MPGQPCPQSPMGRSFFCTFSVFLFIWFTSARTWASGLEPEQVPPELRGWVPWVLSEFGEQSCTEAHDIKRCQWPGLLELVLDERGGTFRLYVDVERRESVVLPGGEDGWPRNVRLDGQLGPVLDSAGAPVVELQPGRHEVIGSFFWSRLPEVLAVGADTAFVRLKLRGLEVPLVRREKGKIWLTDASGSAAEGGRADEVQVQVFRQVEDGVPLLVETRIVFHVSGRPRELALENALLPRTIPISVSGDLALALTREGGLRVQLMPGRHELTLRARALDPNAVLESIPRDIPWPAQEIWTFRAAPELRSVELSGLVGIDASRTELPEQWRKAGAYVVSPGDRLELKTTRRGEEQIPDNQLTFNREFWLDESAEAFTVVDRIGGAMQERFRLDLLVGELGSVRFGADSQVITQGELGRGVEVRTGTVGVEAISRVPRSSELAAVGWSEDARSLEATVHMPPGWDLLWAKGVDSTSSSWVSRWDLFNVFYVLFLTFSILRIAGPLAAFVGFVALVLSRGEPLAPEYLWLPLIALLALLLVLKEGTLRSWLSSAFSLLGVVLLVALLAFGVDQVRNALYPHLRSSEGVFVPMVEQSLEAEMVAAPAPEELSSSSAAAEPSDAKEGGTGSTRPDVYTKKTLGFVDLDSSRSSKKQTGFRPDVIVQTGPGVPEITGRSFSLSWSGPVARDHHFSLILLSPLGLRIVTALRLGALVALMYLLWQASRRRNIRLFRRGTTSPAVLLVFALIVVPRPAFANDPSDARLEQLGKKLMSPASCEPNCLSVTEFGVRLGSELVLRAEVHAGARVAYRLPGSAALLPSANVTVDGRPAVALRLEQDGAYYLRLEPGVHQVELRSPLPGERFTLDIGTPSQLVTVDAPGFTVSGVDDTGRALGGTLTLQREVSLGPAQVERGRSVAVPPYFIVQRRLQFGVSGRVFTRIERLSDPSNAEVLRYDLLAGESPLSSALSREDRTIEVSFPREQMIVEFESTLSLPLEGFEFDLVAPTGGVYSEVWLVDCSVVYRCDVSGIAPSSHLEQDQAVLTFRPFPGDTLHVSGKPLAPAPGSSLTVHKATLTVTPGVRSGRGELDLWLETSRSTVHTVTLPPRATLDEVRVDEVVQAIKTDGDRARVPLDPGRHRLRLSWTTKDGLRALFETPSVDVGASGVNFRTVVELPAERWLLGAGGPAQGPALLFWGYVVLIVLIALLLPRLPFSPLGVLEWMLLGLGLTQVPAAVAVFIAGWFFFIGARPVWSRLGRYRANFLQLAAVGATLFFFGALSGAVYAGLVSSPDMDVVGAGSSNGRLIWFTDRSAGAMPGTWVFSVNLWIFRGFMLAWSLWLAWRLLHWLGWAWSTLNENGFWVPRPPQDVRPRTVEPNESAVGGSAQGPSQSPVRAETESPRE